MSPHPFGTAERHRAACRAPVRASLHWFRLTGKWAHVHGLRKEGRMFTRPLSTLSGQALAAYSRADHEGIISVLSDLPPQILVVAESNDRIPNLFVVGIRGRGFRVHLFGSLQTSLHDRCRERPKLGAVGNQTLECLRVLCVIVRQLPRPAGASSRFEDGLIAFRQLVPFRKIDQHVVGGAALPPARIVIVPYDLIEAELLIVIGPYPFSCIDRAFLQRRIDVATGDLLRDNTELAKSFTGPAPDAHLESL